MGRNSNVPCKDNPEEFLDEGVDGIDNPIAQPLQIYIYVFVCVRELSLANDEGKEEVHVVAVRIANLGVVSGSSRLDGLEGFEGGVYNANNKAEQAREREIEEGVEIRDRMQEEGGREREVNPLQNSLGDGHDGPKAGNQAQEEAQHTVLSDRNRSGRVGEGSRRCARSGFGFDRVWQIYTKFTFAYKRAIGWSPGCCGCVHFSLFQFLLLSIYPQHGIYLHTQFNPSPVSAPMQDPDTVIARLQPIIPPISSLSFADAGTVALKFLTDDDPLSIVSLLCDTLTHLSSTRHQPATSSFLTIWTVTAAVHAALTSTLPPSTAAPYIPQAIQNAYLSLLDKFDQTTTTTNNNNYNTATKTIDEILRATVDVITLAQDTTSLVLSIMQSTLPTSPSSIIDATSLSPARIQLLAVLFSVCRSDPVVMTYVYDELYPCAINILMSNKSSQTTPVQAVVGQRLLPAILSLSFPSALATATATAAATAAAATAEKQQQQKQDLSMIAEEEYKRRVATPLWLVCCSSFEHRQESRMANGSNRGLALLVQFCPLLLAHLPELTATTASPLWTILLRGLQPTGWNMNNATTKNTTNASINAKRSGFSLDNKRALHVLELALGHCQEQLEKGEESKGRGMPAETVRAWMCWVRLYRTAIEDGSVHLFREAWPEIDTIHGAEVETEMEVENNDNNNSNSNNSPISLEFPWMLLLWERALQHRHLTSQKIACVSFLRRQWPPSLLRQVPGHLAERLLIPVMGQSGMYRGEMSEEIQQLAKRFFQRWTKVLMQEWYCHGDGGGGTSPAATSLNELICSVLNVMKSKQQQPSVQLLAANVITAIQAGVAEAVAVAEKGKRESTLTRVQRDEDKHALMEAVIEATAAQPGYGTNTVALQVYAALIGLVDVVILTTTTTTRTLSAGELKTLELIARWLATMPVPLLQRNEVFYYRIARSLARFCPWTWEDPYLWEMIDTYYNGNSVTTARELAVFSMVWVARAPYSSEEWSRYCTGEEKIDIDKLVPCATVQEEEEYVLVGDVPFEKGIRLVNAFMAAVTPLPSASSSNESTLIPAHLKEDKEYERTHGHDSWSLHHWLLWWLTTHQTFFVIHAEKCIGLIKNMRTASFLHDLQGSIEAACQNQGISVGGAQDDDTVLPETFRTQRNVCCELLEAMSSAVMLMDAHEEEEQGCVDHKVPYCQCREALEKFITSFAQQYTALFKTRCILLSMKKGAMEGRDVLCRAHFEVANVMLRGLCAAVPAMKKGMAEGVVVDLVTALLDGQDAMTVMMAAQQQEEAEEAEEEGQRHRTNTGSCDIDIDTNKDGSQPKKKSKRETAQTQKQEQQQQQKKKKKKKRSTKLEPVTLSSWHHLLTWRCVDAVLGREEHGNAKEEDTRAYTYPHAFSSKVLGTATAALEVLPTGSNAVLPIIRCIRCLTACVPFYLRDMHQEAVVEALNANYLRNESVSSGGAKKRCPLTSVSDALTWMGDVLMDALEAHPRKRTAIGAAVVTTCLHASFFVPGKNNEEGVLAMLHDDSEDDSNGELPLSTSTSTSRKRGAVARTVKKLQKLVQRYPRILLIFTTQLSVLLDQNPGVGQYYTQVIIDVAMSGFTTNEDQLNLTDVPLDVPTVKELLCVQSHPEALHEEEDNDSAVHKAFAASQVAPRIQSLILLRNFALGRSLPTNTSNSVDCTKMKKLAWGMFTHLLHLCVGGEEDLATPVYTYCGPVHRQKIRAWQALTVMVPSVPAEHRVEVLQQLIGALGVHNAASVKQYQERCAFYLLRALEVEQQRCPTGKGEGENMSALHAYITNLIEDYEAQRVEAMPSLISIAATAILHPPLSSPPLQASFKATIQRVVSAILPWSGSFVHANRTFAQLVLGRIGEVHPWLCHDNPAFAAYMRFFSSNADLARLRDVMGLDCSGLDRFDADASTTVGGVLCQDSALIGTGVAARMGGGRMLEGASKCLIERVEEFLQEERATLRGGAGAVYKGNIRGRTEAKIFCWW